MFSSFYISGGTLTVQRNAKSICLSYRLTHNHTCCLSTCTAEQRPKNLIPLHLPLPSLPIRYLIVLYGYCSTTQSHELPQGKQIKDKDSYMWCAWKSMTRDDKL